MEILIKKFAFEMGNIAIIFIISLKQIAFKENGKLNNIVILSRTIRIRTRCYYRIMIKISRIIIDKINWFKSIRNLLKVPLHIDILLYMFYIGWKSINTGWRSRRTYYIHFVHIAIISFYFSFDFKRKQMKTFA